MKPIDTHAHLIKQINYDKDLDENIKINLEKLEFIVNISIDLETSNEVIKLNEKYPKLLPVIGIHPTDSNNINVEETIIKLEKLINNKVVALGETGLDYYWEHNKENQKKSFIAHIELGIKHNLPIVVHARNSHEDIYEIIKNYPNVKFLLHSWGGTLSLTKKFLKMENIYFSFSGVLTFKNASEVRELLKLIPKEKILFETDSPYLTPVPFRGKINFPEYVIYVIEEASKIYNISVEEMIRISFKTFLNFFKFEI